MDLIQIVSNLLITPLLKPLTADESYHFLFRLHRDRHPKILSIPIDLPPSLSSRDSFKGDLELMKPSCNRGPGGKSLSRNFPRTKAFNEVFLMEEITRKYELFGI